MQNFANIVKEILPSICTILVALISSSMVIKSSNKASKSEEVKRLQNHLESFYYPFLLLSKKTTQLYNAFDKITAGKRESSLGYLLNDKQFEGNSLVLFNEIIENNKKLNELLIKYSCIINDKNLRDDLSKLSVHYTLLELAYYKKLNGNETEFKEYIFPENVVKNVESEIEKISQRMTELSK